jgi:hypothetical protein
MIKVSHTAHKYYSSTAESTRATALGNLWKVRGFIGGVHPNISKKKIVKHWYLMELIQRISSKVK